MSSDDVRANYNAAGIDIIEMMYEDDYLSIGGNESTRVLAKAAGINQQSRVLDIGCGLGGPALLLAEQFGCHVTGLDLIDINITGAQQRAAQRGLESKTRFAVGDATKLPYADDSFNVVWGLDAWCHVDDKVALISECARVLEPFGTLAFTDWLITADMQTSQQAEVLEAAASPKMTNAQTYLDLLREFGLSLVEHTDISPTFITQYQQVIDGLPTIESTINERYSPKVFAIIKQKNMAILNGFVSGGIGGARFIATNSR